MDETKDQKIARLEYEHAEMLRMLRRIVVIGNSVDYGQPYASAESVGKMSGTAGFVLCCVEGGFDEATSVVIDANIRTRVLVAG